MIVLGVDPGITNMGLGVVEGDGPKARFLHGELVRTRHGEPAPKRVGRIYRAVRGVLEAYRPEAVAVEGQYFYRQNELAYRVGWAMGAVLVAADEAGLPVFAYGPMQVKQALVGTGRADKAQVAYMVRAILNLREAPKVSHVADALAIALTHLAHLRTGATSSM
ncbi:crossover junction endodeoxyribonuclease RuvC [Marinithermus hydrothermalis]|uniref:Crossover junction endodeoxyribonuclease RuvC n=1 Tax=Marinithermus hydrothermalis (strain DSM 14884 / JCM 11576 / T1) TaxID=869210 RepID=F2NME6_MARHT|nr:crossover junction endodeoxyribonuclease RuvC [Marinithermus hydrothermalis]AEB11834.1 Crossover junction endodeoxyribonuclease ruvC [Marinithermus hydrothermalis DSM 14884]